MDRGFSTVRWLDWKSFEADSLTRILAWPNIKLPGWDNVQMLDGRPGARPGAVVRTAPALPFAVQARRGSR
jgi:hypothetical protein